jgi:hypothetical protein
MTRNALPAASRRSIWPTAWKVFAVALFLYVTGGPAVYARNDSPVDFFVQQRQLSDQAAAAAQARANRKPVRDFVPADRTRAAGAVGGAQTPPTFFVNVLGDSLGVEAAEGLTQAFTDKPEIGVIGRAHDSSGLVRDDYYDWFKTADGLTAAKAKLNFVVIIMGINDLQPLKDGADTLDALSDQWRAAYEQRIERLVATFRQAQVPVAWVGLPPMRSERFNAQVVKLNELYKEGAEQAGAKYIDIWDAFTNDAGQYDAYGPDINGQNAKLRAADGIHFTKAGSRKMAQFLEADIRRAFQAATPQLDIANLPPDIEQATDDINAQIRREMGVAPPQGAAASSEPARPLAGPILSLTARPVSAGATLDSAQAGGSAAQPLLAQGESTAPKPDRADDFAWPRL